jgi:hypothetical protein
MARQQEDPVTTSRQDEVTSSPIAFARTAELPVLAIQIPAADPQTADAPVPDASASNALAADAPAPEVPAVEASAPQASAPALSVADAFGDEVAASLMLAGQGSQTPWPEPELDREPEFAEPEPELVPVGLIRSEPQPAPAPDPVMADEAEPIFAATPTLGPVWDADAELVEMTSSVPAVSGPAGPVMSGSTKPPVRHRLSRNSMIAGGVLLFLGTSVAVAAASGGIPSGHGSGHGGRPGRTLPIVAGSSPAPMFSNLGPVAGTPAPSAAPFGVTAPSKALRNVLSKESKKASSALGATARVAKATTVKAGTVKAATVKAATVKAATVKPPTKKTTPKAKPKPKHKPKPKPVSRPSAGTSYRLYNVATGKCVGPLGSTDTQVACGSAVHLKLQKTRTVNGVPLYWLRAASGSGDCVDLPGYGSDPEATPLSEYACATPAASDNQEWTLRDVGAAHAGHEEYALVNHATSECLDVAEWAANGSDAASGQSLTIYQCHSSSWGWDDHLWVFES